MTTGATPSKTGALNSLQEQRERSIQTSFAARVVSYDAATSTVTVEPQQQDTWLVGTERTSGASSTRSENYIHNVPVLFPRSGDFSITFPIADDSFGLVTCTKYSLDKWRDKGTASDPGDLRKFSMSGAVFHPVNLHPTNSQLTNVDTQYLILSENPANADFVALKQDVDDIKTMLDDIKEKYNSHGHLIASGCLGSVATGAVVLAGAATPSKAITESYTVTASKKVKVE